MHVEHVRMIRAIAVAALVMAVVPSIHAQGQMQSYRDPSGRFTFQYPKKNWQIFAGAGSTLVTIGGDKGKASVQIEYFKLNDVIKVAENYDSIVGIESEFIKDRQPGAEQIKGQPLRPDLKDVVVIDYRRPGISGPDHIRQYSIINGANLFRISCVATEAEFPKQERTFEAIAKSFVISAPRTTQD